MELSRSEHIQWCKNRALEYVDSGDINGALSSMGSDLEKHHETRGHSRIQLGMMLLMGGRLSTANEMRALIEGFN